MLLTLGIFGFIQTFLAPGLVLLRLNKYRLSIASFFLVVAPLSVGMNYLLAWLFTSLGIYHSFTMYLIFGAEILFLAGSARRGTNPLLPFHRQMPFSKFEIVITSIASIDLLYQTTRWIKSWGTVMHWSDTVGSYNRWALQWTESHLPTVSGFYPQLVSIIYSISYQFLHTTQIQFFALSAVTFFSVLGASAFLCLGFLRPSLRVLSGVGAITFLYLVNRFSVPWSGYADTPLASMILISLAHAILLDSPNDREHKFLLRCTTVLAGFVALTKQMGIPFVMITPLAVFAFRRERPKPIPLIKMIIVSGLIGFSWYFLKIIEILSGGDKSEFFGIVGTVGLPLSARFPSAFQKLALSTFPISFPEPLRYLLFALVFTILCFGVAGTLFGRFLGCVLAFTFSAWVLLASYDLRNISNSVPLFSILFALGIVKLLGPKSSLSPTSGEPFEFPPLAKRALVVVFALLILFAQLLIPDATLIQHQKAEQVQWAKDGV